MRKKNAFRKLAAILSVFGLTLFFTTCDNPAGSGRGAFCPEEHFCFLLRVITLLAVAGGLFALKSILKCGL